VVITPFIAAITAMLVAAALTPVMRWVAPRLGAVDTPGGRRVHAKATPRMGGAAVIAGFVAALAVTLAVGPGWLPEWKRASLLGLVGGGLLLGAVGAIDDIRDVGAKRKLAGQVAAAAIAAASGARFVVIDLPGFGAIDVPPVLGIALGVVWIVAFVNALNLIDGLDGLAGGVAFFAAVTNAIIAALTGNDLALVLNAALGGAVLGFLFYNFNPATIFLGDTGSMFLGYTLGAASLLTGRQKESTLVSLLVPILALGVPMADTVFAMVRRFLANRPIFAADRGHIHHRLLDVGLTHRRAVLLLYACSMVLCALALGAAFGKDWQVGVALTMAVLTLVLMGRFAGYFELARLRRQEAEQSHAPAAESLRRTIPALVRALDAAHTVDAVSHALDRAMDPAIVRTFEVHGEPGGVAPWSWRAPDTDGVVLLAVPLTTRPASTEWRTSIGYVTDESTAPAHVLALLQLVADMVAAALARCAPGDDGGA
jgi:UDP-GlcNAc:undecaprenyl-phosphate GlcNAc-1-phosphate transferase